MLIKYSSVFWAILAAVILLCEIYVPYRKGVFGSFFWASVANIPLSDAVKSLFFQCVLFILMSMFCYAIATFIQYAMKHVGKRVYADVIAQCNINIDSYGSVFYGDRNYIIKNTYGTAIKKGQVIRIDKKDILNGEGDDRNA